MRLENCLMAMFCIIGGISPLIMGNIAYGKDNADAGVYGDTCSGKSIAKFNGKIINVSAGGNIQAAMNKAKPGDTIVLACGNYQNGGVLNTSGTSQNWIKVKAAKRHCATIKGNMRVNKADYVRFAGLKVVDSSIGVQTSHHIEMVNNLVIRGHMTLNLSDFLLVDGNEVYGDSKSYNLVSILNPQNITGDKTTRNRIIVRNNVIHHNLWIHKTDGAGLIFDNGIERQLVKHDPANFPALKLNRVKWASYTMGGVIDNNIFYNNNGSGLTLYNAHGVTVINNISTNNNQRKGGEGPWAGQILNTNGSNNVFINNVAVTPGTKESYGISNQYFQDYSSPTFPRNKNTTWIDNTTCNLEKPGNESVSTQGDIRIPASTNNLGNCASLKPLGVLNGDPPTRHLVDCGQD